MPVSSSLQEGAFDAERSMDDIFTARQDKGKLLSNLRGEPQCILVLQRF